MTDEITGPYGTATSIALPDIPSAAETVAMWLITAPAFHPLWSQYFLACVRLRDGVPGFPPPVRKFDGATHEVLVVALNPEVGRQDASTMAGRMEAGQLAGLYLLPVNIAEQFIATDDEMSQLAAGAAGAVVRGRLNPETADAPDAIRWGLLTALTKTLAHIRGEEHAP